MGSDYQKRRPHRHPKKTWKARAGPEGPAGPTGPAGPAGGGVSAATYTASFTNPGSGGGTTFYASPTITSYGTDIANNTAIANGTQANFITSPVACTVAALNVGVNNYFSPAPDTTTIKVYKNAVATTMTCSVGTDGNGGGCTDANHTFSAIQRLAGPRIYGNEQ